MGGPLAPSPLVPGLTVRENAISEEQETSIVAWIEQLSPEPMARRHRLDLYGDGAFVRTSVGRKVSKTVPSILSELAIALFSEEVDAITVSEYMPGQGVVQHTDRLEAGRVIRTLSLLADGVLYFRGVKSWIKLPAGGSAEYYDRHEVAFPRRALVEFRDPCRSAPWTHELAPVLERRMSIAFRGATRPAV